MRNRMTAGQIRAIEERLTRAYTWKQVSAAHRRKPEPPADDLWKYARFIHQKDSYYELRDPTDMVEVAMVTKRFKRWEEQDRAARINGTADATTSPYAVYGGRQTPTKLLKANLELLADALNAAMDYARTWPGYTFGVCYQDEVNGFEEPTWRWLWDPRQQKAIAG